MKEDKQLTEFKKPLENVLKAAQEIQAVSYENIMDAADVLADVKTIGEKITARKEDITKPMNEALKSARAFFKPFEKQYEEAEAIVKEKVLAWHEAHWEEQTVQDNTVYGTRGKVTVVERFKVEIEDADKLPRELLSPDVDRIKLALESGMKVKGATLVPVYGITAGRI
jgi:hypothetical protein